MDDNRFNLAMIGGTKAEQHHSKKLYFLSTARSALGSYHQDPYGTGVLFKLDGVKLGQTYSGKALDYWGPDFRALGKNEMEDRIFSDSPYIENARKYILEVHIYINPKEVQREEYKVKVRKLYLAAKLANIPTYFYDDKKAFNIANKLKTVKPTADILGKGIKSPQHRQRMSRDSMKPYLELVYVNEFDKLSKDAKRIAERFVYWPMDAKPSMSADVHNIKNSPEKIDKLVKAWRKMKINTVDEFVAVMTAKWEKILK